MQYLRRIAWVPLVCAVCLALPTRGMALNGYQKQARANDKQTVAQAEPKVQAAAKATQASGKKKQAEAKKRQAGAEKKQAKAARKQAEEQKKQARAGKLQKSKSKWQAGQNKAAKAGQRRAAKQSEISLVLTLQHASAEAVAKHLHRLFRGAIPVRVTADAQSNVPMVRAEKGLIAEVREVVGYLDDAAGEQADRSEWSIRIYEIESADAKVVRELILKLAPFSRATPVPRVECDRRTNSLVVNAVIDDFPAIERIIEAVDVSGN